MINYFRKCLISRVQLQKTRLRPTSQKTPRPTTEGGIGVALANLATEISEPVDWKTDEHISFPFDSASATNSKQIKCFFC